MPIVRLGQGGKPPRNAPPNPEQTPPDGEGAARAPKKSAAPRVLRPVVRPAGARKNGERASGAPAKYLGSYLEDLPPVTLPEIAFAGRSNVGKSSALNALCGVGGLARVSKTPGRTQALNFFEIEGRWIAVDLPGYGHAQVSKSTREDWKRWIEGYLFGRSGLRLVVSLVDSRIPAQDSDRQLLRSLVEGRVPTLVVATKLDAIVRGKRDATLAKLAADLHIKRDQMLGFSAHEGLGIEDLQRMLRRVIK